MASFVSGTPIGLQQVVIEAIDGAGKLGAATIDVNVVAALANRSAFLEAGVQSPTIRVDFENLVERVAIDHGPQRAPYRAAGQRAASGGEREASGVGCRGGNELAHAHLAGAAFGPRYVEHVLVEDQSLNVAW